MNSSSASPGGKQNRHNQPRTPLSHQMRGHPRHSSHSNLHEAATAQALLNGLTQAASKSNPIPPSSPTISKKKKRSRSPYKCHKCGKPKKGHICTIMPSSALIKNREAKTTPTPLSPPPSHQPVQMDSYFDPPSSPPHVLSQRSLHDMDESEDNYFSTSSLDLAAMFPVPATTTTTTTATTTNNNANNNSNNPNASTLPSSLNTSFTSPSSGSLGDLGEAAMWNTDSLFADSTDEDWAALGYIDERFPIGGVGVNLNSKKKVPFFQSWFDMAYGGLDMLATFLKTQRPSWPPLQEVLENLEAEKEKINIWKEDFDKNVIKRALADHEPTSAVPTSAILGNMREVIEVEDSQNRDSQESSQENFGPSKRQRLDQSSEDTLSLSSSKEEN